MIKLLIRDVVVLIPWAQDTVCGVWTIGNEKMSKGFKMVKTWIQFLYFKKGTECATKFQGKWESPKFPWGREQPIIIWIKTAQHRLDIDFII